MSAQLLGPRWLRRLSRLADAEVVRGWGHGGYGHDFVTADHRHGWYDLKTGEVHWSDAGEHPYTSCYSDVWPEALRAVRP